MPATRTITVDPAVGARYISLSDRPVASTEEFSDDILVDLVLSHDFWQLFVS